jgi:hypothetical protein
MEVKLQQFQPPLYVPATLSPINHCTWRLNSVVVTATATEWTSEESWVDSRQEQEISLFSKASNGTHLAFYFKGTCHSLIRGKTPVEWSWLLTPPGVQIKNECSYIYSRICLHGVLRNFTFTCFTNVYKGKWCTGLSILNLDFTLQPLYSRTNTGILRERM